MTEQTTKVSAGEVIVLTEGEYSDYGIAGYIVACLDFDMDEAREEFIAQFKGETWERRDNFVAWLITTERAVPVQHREIHIGGYSDLEIS